MSEPHCHKCCPKFDGYVFAMTLIGEIIGLIVLIHFVVKFW